MQGEGFPPLSQHVMIQLQGLSPKPTIFNEVYLEGLGRDKDSKMADKPREELHYEDFYPDLDSTAELDVFTRRDQLEEEEEENGVAGVSLETILNSELRKIHKDGTGFKIEKHAIKQPQFYDLALHDRRPDELFYKAVAEIDPALFKYGYHKVKDDFKLPTPYIRTVSLGVSPDNNGTKSGGISYIDNDDLVEYDMDEQDEYILNSQLKISKEEFEIAMSLIDKQWYEIERAMLPKSTKGCRWKQIDDKDKSNPQSANDDKWLLDQRCAVCDDGECDNNNAIVFCDGCDLAVHQDCYGVAFIPEGQWLCRKCMIARRKLRVSCIFCPNDSTVSTAVPGVGPVGEAFKQTDSSQWAHLICALWIPEVEIANPVYMEPIINMRNIPKDRWKLICYICRKRGEGACIQCTNKNCFQAFHPTCARRAGLYMNMTEGIQGAVNNQSSMVVCCDKHTPAEFAMNHNVNQTVRDAQQFYKTEFLNQTTSKPRNKDRRVEQRWKTTLGAPVLPRMIYDKVVDFLNGTKSKSPTTAATAQSICKYWVLKRELKRGAWLIKRLQTKLDLSLNYSGIKESQFDNRLVEYQRQLKYLTGLRQYVRKLQQRQQLKLDQAKNYGQVLKIGYFPECVQFGQVVDLIQRLDLSQFFQSVPQDEVYLSVIQSPMSTEIMRQKIDQNQYLSLQEGLDDVKLMLNNARYYNEDTAPVVVMAREIELAIHEFLKSSSDVSETATANWEISPQLMIPKLKNGLPNWSPYAVEGLQVTEWIGRRIMREMTSPLTSDVEDDYVDSTDSVMKEFPMGFGTETKDGRLRKTGTRKVGRRKAGRRKVSGRLYK